MDNATWLDAYGYDVLVGKRSAKAFAALHVTLIGSLEPGSIRLELYTDGGIVRHWFWDMEKAKIFAEHAVLSDVDYYEGLATFGETA